jgi:hypothetical protein
MWHVWERNAYRVLVGMPKGKKQPARPKCKRKHSIKMDLMEIRTEYVK